MLQTNRESLLLLGYVLFAVGRYERAMKVVRGLVGLYPDDFEGERLLAAIYARLNLPAEVLVITSRQLDLTQPGPAKAILHWLRAEALWSLDRKDEAAQHTAAFLRWRETFETEGGALD